jgi:hypothetical protein
MTSPLLLSGLRADSPAAALALYGIARLLGSETAVRWTPEDGSGWHAEITSDRCADVDELADLLLAGIREDPFSDLQSLAKDVNELMPQTWLAGILREDGVARLLIGLCAEAPLRAQGQVSLTPLCVYYFGTRGTLFGSAANQDASVSEAVLRSVLLGPWAPKKNCNTLGLDPGARRQDGAIMGPDPSADGVRGVPGLVPLMLRGLATVAPMPGGVRVRGGAFVRDRNGAEFRWPVFTSPIPATAVPMLVGRDWTARTAAERAAAGVEAVFASRILRPHGRISGRLAFGRRVA